VCSFGCSTILQSPFFSSFAKTRQLHRLPFVFFEQAKKKPPGLLPRWASRLFCSAYAQRWERREPAEEKEVEGKGRTTAHAWGGGSVSLEEEEEDENGNEPL
jgi:hypothetical protein